jgi:EmrB/QacA subfamily drug resistance transporter
VSATTAPPVATTAPADTGAMSHRQIMESLSGLLLALFVAMISATVVSNALPQIIGALKGTQSQYTWVVTAALLTATASTPIWGKLADLFSKKALVQIAIVVFVVGSMICGLSRNTPQLIAARAFQGIGMGGLQALVQVVIAAMIPPRQRGRYNGYLGAVLAVATVGGPLLGGVIVDTSWLGWRWCFYVGVPFAIVALLLLQKTLHIKKVRREDAKVDYLGATLIAAGVSLLLIWVTFVHHEFAWVSWQTAAMVGGALVLLVLALVVESRVREPIVPLSILARRTPVLAILASLAVGMAMFGGAVFLGQYFQIGRGYSPTEAGLMTIPLMAGVLIASTVSGLLITKTGRIRPYIIAGTIVLVGGFALLARIDHQTNLVYVGVGMALVGLGVGMSMQNLILAVQNTVALRDIGAATSTVTFFRSLGGTIGVSVLGAVLADRVATDIPNRLAAAGIQVQAGGGQASSLDLRALPAPVAAIIRAVYGDAIGHIFLISAIIAVVGVIAALALPPIMLRSSVDLTQPSAAAEEPSPEPSPQPATPEPAPEPATRDVEEQVFEAQGVGVGAQGVGAQVFEAQGVGAPGVGAPAVGAPGAEGRGVEDGRANGVRYQGVHAAEPVPMPATSGAVVSGRVTGPDGRPVAGAMLTVTDFAGRQVAREATGMDGGYRLQLPSGGTYLLICAAQHHQPMATMLTVGLGDTTRDLTLAGASRLEGRVLGHGGEPIPGATVTLTDARGEVVGAAMTAPDGGYVLADLYPGEYTLTATAQRTLPVARAVTVDGAGAQRLDVVLRSNATVAGTIRAARTGQPVPDASVTLLDAYGNLAGTATTGDDGRYEFADLLPGVYTLAASGYAPVAATVELGGERTDQDVMLGESAPAARIGESEFVRGEG